MKRFALTLLSSSLLATLLGVTPAYAYFAVPGDEWYDDRYVEANLRHSAPVEQELTDADLAAASIDTGRFDRPGDGHAGAPNAKGKGPLAPTGLETWVLTLFAVCVGAGWYHQQVRRKLLAIVQ